MNAGPTSKRIYDVLRNQILQSGYPPGAKLDPAVLAEELGTSPTPVRDALHILAGEDLVVAIPIGGFTTAWFNEHGLHDLYGWNSDVLHAALHDQRFPVAAPPPAAALPDDREHLAERLAAFFQRIADCSMNAEHGREQARINARLNVPRITEVILIEDSDMSLNAMKELFEQRDFLQLRRMITRYTTRRKRLSGKICRHIERSNFK